MRQPRCLPMLAELLSLIIPPAACAAQMLYRGIVLTWAAGWTIDRCGCAGLSSGGS